MIDLDSPTSSNEVSIDDRGRWDCKVRVRGVVIALLHPDEQQARCPVPKPGIIVRLWRVLFGDPSNLEADAVLKMALSVCPRGHHAHIKSLTSGERFSIVNVYKVAQEAWANDLRRQYMEQIAATAKMQLDAQREADAPTSESKSNAARGSNSFVPVALRHSSPMPAFLYGGLCKNPGAWKDSKK